MRKFLFLLLLLSIWLFNATAQQPKPATPKPKNTNQQAPGKKYTSLLWEITGNGLKKPSYLFGTMHISDKLVFHLGDPFYNALRSVDVVALETNPENWQDDYNESVFLKNRSNYGSRFMSFSSFAMNDKMKITSFAIDNNEEAIKAALAVEPSLVNGLLYRTYGSKMADFEEDTYLDMYIFQTGKKLGKKMAGVENFRESEKLVMEAYKDMYTDDKRKRRSYDFEDMFSNPKKMEEAYRNGDLDALDSLDALEVVSEKFQEKFMFKRNEIQAKNIDSIVKKQSLFVAVGAAHLPGKRGVIEMLREMGYSLRPIKIGQQNSRQKETIDKLRYRSAFLNQTSEDGFYNVSIPGKKFYKFTEWGGMDIKQFADMPNGSYYMVVRVKTNSHFQGQSTDMILKKVDSLFYENIPGKILKKTPITKNGFKGWEIVNRIRRGDHQRYNIFVTPFEIIVFKMSGNGEYIMNGAEASTFFNSIKLKEYTSTAWVNFQPPTGGFGVQLPYTPSLLKNDNDDRLEYAAHDQQNSYLVLQNNFYPTSYVEEDTFDLKLMDESYAFSPFIDKQISRKIYTQDGYPAMTAKYLHKDKSVSEAKFIIKGPVYYTALVHYKNENDAAKKFLSSFSIKPFIYPAVKTRTDTSMKFTVSSPFFPEEKNDEEMEKLLNSMMMMRFSDEMDEEDILQGMFGNYNYKMIGNDTLGEKIFVTYHKPGKYDHVKDSAKFWQNNFRELLDDSEDEEDSTFIFKLDKKYELPGGVKCREIHLTDTGSSRLIVTKFLYKAGHVFTLAAITDTLSASPFISTFFSSFLPADTLKGESLFTRKSKKFFEDYFSTDSVISKKAARSLNEIRFDSLDVPLIKNAIERVNWKTRDYTDAKTSFIWELGNLKDSTITPYLKDLYFKVKDTSDFQNAILSALLSQKTKASFVTFKDLILQEPPIEAEGSSYYRPGRHMSYFTAPRITFSPAYYDIDRSGSGTWSDLYDTLPLVKNIFPDFLQLMNIEDYRDEVMSLLVIMVDSGYLKATDYETFFSKFYLDAKQALKKQVAKEESDNIEKESRKGKKKSFYDYYDEDEDEEMNEGNEKLLSYAILMLPFYDKNPGIPTFFEQLLKTKDKQLYYDACILLLRNKKQVPDSFFTRYAKLEDYRCDLYDDLKKIKMADKFPAQFKTQENFTKSLLVESNYDYNKPDSLTYIDKLPVTYKNKKGWVYFYKYKEERDDNFWQLCSVGMQPGKQDSVDTENSDFTTTEGRKIANDKPLKEQMIKMLNEMLNAQRDSASDFYDARRYDIYKNYLSDIVKRERFND